MNPSNEQPDPSRTVPVIAFLVPVLLLLGLVAARLIQAGVTGGPNLAILAVIVAYALFGVGVGHRTGTLSRLGLAGTAFGVSLLVAILAVPSFRATVLARPPDQSPVSSAATMWPDVEPDGSWWHQFCDEYDRASELRWSPYVYWRRAPFAGEVINVDDNGRRRTWNPDETAGVPRIWTFGGSTMWGEGARDDFTIASLLSKDLNDAGVVAHCENFGEKGYVSTQSLLALYLELRKGNVPDVAVFYEGFNDVWSAFQNELSGYTIQERRRGLDYRPPVEDAVLIEELAAVYLENVRLLRTLADHYDFEVLCYLQPVSVVDKPLTDAERRTIEKYAQRLSIPPELREFVRAAYRRIRAGMSPETMQDLSSIFGSTETDLYIDICHITEEGNEVVAERIAHDVLSLLDTD